MSRLRGVLFDFGNTLFSHESLAATIAGCCTRLGADVPAGWAQQLAARIDVAAHTPDELRHPRDLDAAVWRARWHELYAVADDEVPGLGADVYRAMHDPLAWHPYASTAATLRRLHTAHVPVGVVSNTGWDVRAVFAAHGLGELVHAFLLSYEAGLVKPAAAMFERACTAIGLPPAEVLMVGDDIVADAGAARAGLTTLLLPVVPPGAENRLGAVAHLVAEE
jgi:HAD superfamily hydrolase (TIGR01493 family)